MLKPEELDWSEVSEAELEMIKKIESGRGS